MDIENLCDKQKEYTDKLIKMMVGDDHHGNKEDMYDKLKAVTDEIEYRNKELK